MNWANRSSKMHQAACLTLGFGAAIAVSGSYFVSRISASQHYRPPSSIVTVSSFRRNFVVNDQLVIKLSASPPIFSNDRDWVSTSMEICFSKYPGACKSVDLPSELWTLAEFQNFVDALEASSHGGSDE